MLNAVSQAFSVDDISVDDISVDGLYCELSAGITFVCGSFVIMSTSSSYMDIMTTFGKPTVTGRKRYAIGGQY